MPPSLVAAGAVFKRSTLMSVNIDSKKTENNSERKQLIEQAFHIIMSLKDEQLNNVIERLVSSNEECFDCI